MKIKIRKMIRSKRKIKSRMGSERVITTLIANPPFES